MDTKKKGAENLMAVPQEKIYKPINGEEAIDLILNEFYKQLVNSGMFPVHRVWHEFEFAGGVRVKGWSTKTEEVKFEVKGGTATAETLGSAEHVEGRVDVKLVPAPPSLQRETLPNFPCMKGCGYMAKSRAGKKAHERFCKAEVKLDPVAEIIKSGFESPKEPEMDRHISE